MDMPIEPPPAASLEHPAAAPVPRDSVSMDLDGPATIAATTAAGEASEPPNVATVEPVEHTNEAAIEQQAIEKTSVQEDQPMMVEEPPQAPIEAEEVMQEVAVQDAAMSDAPPADARPIDATSAPTDEATHTKVDSPTEDAAQLLISLGAVQTEPAPVEPVPRQPDPGAASQIESTAQSMELDAQPDQQSPPSPVPSASTMPATPATASYVNAEGSTSSSPTISLKALPGSSNMQAAFVPTYSADPPTGPWKDADEFKKAWREWAGQMCDPPQKLVVRACASFGGANGRSAGYCELACTRRHHTGGRGCHWMARAGQRVGEGAKGPYYLRTTNLVHGNHAVEGPKRARAPPRAREKRPQRQRKKPKLEELYDDDELEFDEAPVGRRRGGNGTVVEPDNSTESDEDYTLDEPAEDDTLIHVTRRTDKKAAAERPSRAPLMPRAPRDDEGDDPEPVILDSLKKFLASLDTPKSDVCSSALATIKANGGTDNVKELLDQPQTELRALLNACDLRPAQRVIIFNRILAAADRYTRHTKRRTRRSMAAKAGESREES